jgi:CheY-like chemotaxis protein
MPNTTILLATPDRQLENVTREVLWNGLSDLSIVIQSARNYDELQRMLIGGAHYDLLVSDLDLPADDNSPIRDGEHRGFQVLSSLREGNNSLPVILISPDHNQQMRLETERQGYAQMLERDFTFGDDLPSEARTLIEKAPAPNLPRYLRVTFTAESHDENWKFELHGENFSFDESGSIILQEKIINSLKDKSAHIATRFANQEPVDWEYELREIGRLLLQEISNSTEFEPKFNAGLRKIDDDLRRVKILFRIRQTLHPIILEALVRDDKDEEFWMLQAPICRRLLVRGFYDYPEPLFACGSRARATTLHCLLIAADTSGVVPGLTDNTTGKGVDLEQLTHVQREHDDIRALFRRCRPKVSVFSVTSDLPDKSRSFRDKVIDALRSRQWDFVHYTGHSYFDADQGYLFFPPALPGDGPDKFRIGEFTAELSKTRFLYLSSCQSSHDNCVLALAKSSIPSAIGFRWHVSDAHAYRYALAFYGHLFGDVEHCLQHAFLSAKKDAHTEFPREKIWASPVLLVKAS